MTDDIIAFANRVADHADVIDVPNGRYLRWSSDCGAEIWIQLDDANDLIGMMPHFAGESLIRVGITSRINRPDDTVLDGAFFLGTLFKRQTGEMSSAAVHSIGRSLTRLVASSMLSLIRNSYRTNPKLVAS